MLLVAAIVANVCRVRRGEAAQAVRGQQVTRANVHDGLLLPRSQRAVWQRHGQQLIGSQSVVVASRPIDHVAAVAARVVPEPGKPGPCAFCQGSVRLGRFPQSAREFSHAAQPVIPQGTDLDRLADARRHDPISHLGVHPGQLHAGLAGIEQTVFLIQVDSIARASLVPGNDLSQYGKQFSQQILIARCREVSTDGLKIPKSGVRGVVLGLA